MNLEPFEPCTLKLNSGILGGTFDPVHTGHVQIAESFLNSGVIDRLLVLPAPSPPHKQNQERRSFQDRLNMLQIAFQDIERVEVSDIEQQLPEPSYTISTINYLQNSFPDQNWYLCFGGDTLATFHKWYRYQEILKHVTLLVAERPGYDSSSIKPEILEKTIIVDHEPVDVSSTDIRDSVRIDGKNLHVPSGVWEYIREKGLY